MGMSTYCCLNPLPPSPSHASTPSFLPSKSTLVPRKVNNDDERSRRRRNKNVMATITCAIVIGLEMGDLVISNKINGGDYSMASDQMRLETHDELLIQSKSNNINNKRKVGRWSDKRVCPPWHINSLETIVPENLPRPSFARRKWEGVSYSSSKSAPQVKFSGNSTSTSCFTM